MSLTTPSAAVLIGVVVALAPAAPALAATWSVDSTPNATSGRNQLRGVDALSTTDAWTVGSADASSAPWTRPLAAHWDGTAWTLASPPAPSAGGQLNGVDGSASGDVWAVGAAGAAPLVQHWDGTAWSTVPGPSPAGATSAVLRGVKVLGASDAWAVGHAAVPFGSPRGQTLIQHWNGTSWSIVPSPSPDPTINELLAVEGVAADDVWAVGGAGDDGYGGGTVTGLVLHWNGSTWTRVTIPGADGTFSVIRPRDVAAVASDNVWVVGTAFHRWQWRWVPYLLRWNGQTWQHTTIPSAPDGGFNGVTALSPTTVYAVGQAGSRTLVARWNGSGWNQETTPSPGSYNALADAASTGTGTIWAVGMQVNGGTGRTLAIRTGDG